MYKNPYPGKFIVFEGLDGSGQTTQAKHFYNLLQRYRCQVILTKEPTGDSPVGKRIRRVLQKKEEVAPAELQKLFIQDRKEHLEDSIIPALKEGQFVISDRYFFSTCAFGGIDLDIEWLIDLNKDFIMPDATLFLDVPPEVCIERINKRGQGFEFFEEVKKLTKVRGNYLHLAKGFKNVYVVNGQPPEKEVFSEVKGILAEHYQY